MRAQATTDARGGRQFGDLPNTGLTVANFERRTEEQVWSKEIDPSKIVSMTLSEAMGDDRYSLLASHLQREGFRFFDQFDFGRVQSGRIRQVIARGTEYREKAGKIFCRLVEST